MNEEFHTYPNADIAVDADGRPNGSFARIVSVVPDSPAYEAGFEPGCFVTHANGQPVRDIIDWRWIASDDELKVGYIDLDGERGEVELWREPGEDWGFEFEGLVFDGVRQCRNACTFCFMRMLPKGMRTALYLRDDDFRLSFLVGTFVTLTQITPEEEQRICEQRISPLRVSLQASDPEVRKRLIGKHAQHGIDALDRLLGAGIEFHAQIVLVPDCNDGQVLADTLSWAYSKPGSLGVGIVPLGYTKYQTAFSSSFNDCEKAREVLALVEPFQRRALEERGTAWAFPADEFYRSAYGSNLLENLPPAEYYGTFEMFEDGIGIIRSTVCDWDDAVKNGVVAECAHVLRNRGAKAVMVAGCAQREFLGALVGRSGIEDVFEPLYVKNSFFGGNVDVTGLLVGQDIACAVREHSENAMQVKPAFYLVPRVVFNDDALTLDDMTLEDMGKASGARLSMVSCSPKDYFKEITKLARQM